METAKRAFEWLIFFPLSLCQEKIQKATRIGRKESYLPNSFSFPYTPDPIPGQSPLFTGISDNRWHCCTHDHLFLGSFKKLKGFVTIERVN
ncbi:hypothetical protein CEXT_683721 [Caerostris extrusa]|uniref:Uncharacterized protein n=1 Tax=Caerostris extrusa TaxID=172846 RepID=A0AAV4UQH3_CAEEX|nr:hypothetical protein CEXT_683721 [Caerostris extrusa]